MAESYVFAIRRKNGEYYINRTGNLEKALKDIKDKDKVLGYWICEDSTRAVTLKNVLNKMTRLQIEETVIYPNTLRGTFSEGEMERMKFNDAKELNETLKLDTEPVKRIFPYMLGDDDKINEMYNNILTCYANREADSNKFYNEYNLKHGIQIIPRPADINLLMQKVDIAFLPYYDELKKAFNKGLSEADARTVFHYDFEAYYGLKYSVEEIEGITENIKEGILYDEDGNFVVKEAFNDIDESYENIKYFRYNGYVFAEISKPDNTRVLYNSEYTVNPLGGHKYEVTKVAESYKTEADFTQAVKGFSSLMPLISSLKFKDSEIIKEYMEFLDEVKSGANITSEGVEYLLSTANTKALFRPLDETDTNDMGTQLKIAYLKASIKSNISFHKKLTFDEKLEKYINAVKKDKNELKNIPTYIDIDGFRRITSEIKGALAYLPQRAKKDFTCVKNAVTLDGTDILHADKELRNNIEIAATAIKNNRKAGLYLPEELYNELLLKSSISLENINSMSVEEILSAVCYLDHDVNPALINNYIDSLNDDEKEMAAAKCWVEKWNREEKALIKEPKLAVLKLKESEENKAIKYAGIKELNEMNRKPDINNYDIVYIDNKDMAEFDILHKKLELLIPKLFLKINGMECPDNYYGMNIEKTDIIAFTENGFDFSTFFIDDIDFVELDNVLDDLTMRKINDNIDVRVEAELLKRLDEKGLSDREKVNRLNEIESSYKEIFEISDIHSGKIEQETGFELNDEDKKILADIHNEEVSMSDNICFGDRVTYENENSEIILKKGAVNKAEDLKGINNSYKKRKEVIENISKSYAIESSDDYAKMFLEYDDYKDASKEHYRLVKIDNISGNIIKINEELFSSEKDAEEYFNTFIAGGREELVDYNALVNKSLELSGLRSNNELVQGIQNIMDSDKFKGWCVARANLFHKKYTLNNSLGIYFQKPDAGIVFGARQWQEYGRQVKKGEKGIKITVPVKYAYESKPGGLLAMIRKNISRQLNENKDIGVYRLGESNLTFIGSRNNLYSMLINDKVVLSNVDEKTLGKYIKSYVMDKTPVAFTSANVFDISQVEEPEYLAIRNLKEEDKKDLLTDAKSGKPLKTKNGAYKVKNTQARINKLNTVLDMEIKEEEELNVEEVYKSLNLISSKSGVPIREAEEENMRGAQGYYSRSDNEIVISKNLNKTEKVSVAIHEMAHSRLHYDMADASRHLKEVQAEAVAYIVNKSLGIDTKEASFNYMANWMGSRRMSEIKDSLDLINDEAQKLYEEITQDLKERNVRLKKDEYIKNISKDKGIIKNEIKLEIKDIILNNQKLANKLENSRADDLNILRSEAAGNESENQNVENLKRILGKRGDLYLRQETEINQIKLLANEMQREADKEDIDISKVEDIRSRVNLCNDRINSIAGEIKDSEKEIREVFNLIDREKTTIVERFKAFYRDDAVNALESIKSKYKVMKDLDKNDIIYLTTSPYINEVLSSMTSEDNIEQFAGLCARQIENVEAVKADNNTFVEVIESDYEELKKGEVISIKNANEIVKNIEKGMEELRKNGIKNKEIIPCVTCKFNIYTVDDKTELYMLQNFKLLLGSKKHKDLISALELRTKDYRKYDSFMESCKAAVKERNVKKHKLKVPTLENDGCIERGDYCMEPNEYKKDDIESILNEENNYKAASNEQEQDKEKTMESHDYSR